MIYLFGGGTPDPRLVIELLFEVAALEGVLMRLLPKSERGGQ
jgi:hypothetical protein